MRRDGNEYDRLRKELREIGRGEEEQSEGVKEKKEKTREREK